MRFGFGFGLEFGFVIEGHQQHAPCRRHEAGEGRSVGWAVGGLHGDQSAAVEGRVERGQAQRACRAAAQLQEVALHCLVRARVRARVGARVRARVRVRVRVRPRV